jgi:hypothetical protein
MRVERVVLEDHRDVPVLRRQLVDDLAADHHASLGDRLEPGDHPQSARLAAAARADEDDELAVRDLQVEIRHGPGPVPVDLRQLLERDLGHPGDRTLLRRRLGGAAKRSRGLCPRDRLTHLLGHATRTA